MGAQQHRRKFTSEFKDEAVRLVNDSGRPIAEVARDIGVNEGTLGNWVNLWRSEIQQANAAIAKARPHDPPQQTDDWWAMFGEGAVDVR